MIITNAPESATDTAPSTQDTIDTVATVALDEVNGGWMYGPYGYPRPYYASPHCAGPYPSPYAMARQEARFERRAAWAASRNPWWGY